MADMADPEFQIDFSFVDDDRLRQVLDDYHVQARQSFEHSLHAAAVVLSGGVVEGVLTWGIQRRLRQDDTLEADLKAIPRLTLHQLIDKSVRLGLIGSAASQASWAVKDFRNYIHPYKVLTGSSRLDRSLAASALGAVKEIVRSLRGRVLSSDDAGQVPSQDGRQTAALSEALNLCWIIPGSLAGCRGPRSRNELDDLRGLGVRALVRLASRRESAVTGSDVERSGLRDCHEPVKDFSVPSSEQINRVVEFATVSMKDSCPVAVSCGAGYGRTSTLLACVLVAMKRTDFLGDLISWEDGVDGTSKSVFPGGA